MAEFTSDTERAAFGNFALDFIRDHPRATLAEALEAAWTAGRIWQRDRVVTAEREAADRIASLWR